MKLTGFDLNLLLVFDAMMQEQQTSKAGQRIGMSQPAVSKALSRLRYHLKDDLFIRSPKGMSPTPLAMQMYGEVRSALQKLDGVLNPTAFDPATSDWEFRVVVKHALRNALIPTVTVVGLQVGVLLGGNMIVETVFGWPGLGRLVVQAIFSRDFPLVQGAVMIYAFIFVMANLIVDVLYTYLNPKITL